MHFINDILTMTDARGISRNIVAQLIFAGRQAELVAALTQGHSDASDLDEQARAFVLPERLRSDYASLLASVHAPDRDDRGL